MRSHVHNSWKLHYNPGLLCTKYTCRNCWYSRNRTNMTVKSHHNPDYQLRSDICSDNPTTIGAAVWVRNVSSAMAVVAVGYLTL